MSDPQAKAERSRAKDLRQGVIEQRPPLPKKKKKIEKPYNVCTWWRWGAVAKNQPEKWVRYKCATLEQAQKLIEKEQRSWGKDREWWIEHNGEKIGA